MHSGSYTIDLLESAGANPRLLRRIADRSVILGNWDSHELATSGLDRSPVEWLFKKSPVVEYALSLARKDGLVLETSHLLTASVEPDDPDKIGANSDTAFPLEQRTGSKPKTPLQNALELRMCDIMVLVMEDLANNVYTTLRTRHHAITEEEDASIDQMLGVYYRDMEVEELEFIVAALNTWFTHRRILTDPAELCLRTIARCSSLLYGAQLFAEAGGNIKNLDAGLDVAKKFSPERDLAGLALFERDGRIQVGQYTYRNTFLVDTKISKGFPLRRVGLEAIRPVSLVSRAVIIALEALLSQANLNELEIQTFLVQHREILEALGYAAVRPHICLYTEEREKLVPDFILEIPGGAGFDILDLIPIVFN